MSEIKINNTSPGRQTTDYEGTIDGVSFRVQIDQMDAPEWYDSELSDDQKDDVLTFLDTLSITDDDWSWSHAGDGSFGYVIHATASELEARGLEYSDVIEHICDNAQDTLDEDDYAAWLMACNDGRGPDASADINGIQWVVNSDDVRLVRAILTVDEYEHDEEAQAAVNVLRKKYFIDQ